MATIRSPLTSTSAFPVRSAVTIVPFLMALDIQTPSLTTRTARPLPQAIPGPIFLLRAQIHPIVPERAEASAYPNRFFLQDHPHTERDPPLIPLRTCRAPRPFWPA